MAKQSAYTSKWNLSPTEVNKFITVGWQLFEISVVDRGILYHFIMMQEEPTNG